MPAARASGTRSLALCRMSLVQCVCLSPSARMSVCLSVCLPQRLPADLCARHPWLQGPLGSRAGARHRAHVPGAPRGVVIAAVHAAGGRRSRCVRGHHLRWQCPRAGDAGGPACLGASSRAFTGNGLRTGPVSRSARPQSLSGHPQVWWPWANAVFGQLQFELLMGVIWENMCEPANFGARARPAVPVGVPLPGGAQQPSRLGVDTSQAPLWEVEVRQPRIQ
jgi:hypothetical protein